MAVPGPSFPLAHRRLDDDPTRLCITAPVDGVWEKSCRSDAGPGCRRSNALRPKNHSLDGTLESPPAEAAPKEQRSQAP